MSRFIKSLEGATCGTWFHLDRGLGSILVADQDRKTMENVIRFLGAQEEELADKSIQLDVCLCPEGQPCTDERQWLGEGRDGAVFGCCGEFDRNACFTRMKKKQRELTDRLADVERESKRLKKAADNTLTLLAFDVRDAEPFGYLRLSKAVKRMKRVLRDGKPVQP